MKEVKEENIKFKHDARINMKPRDSLLSFQSRGKSDQMYQSNLFVQAFFGEYLSTTDGVARNFRSGAPPLPALW
jgi:hypothetical protein